MTVQELLNAAEKLSLLDRVKLATQLMQTATEELQTSPQAEAEHSKDNEWDDDLNQRNQAAIRLLRSWRSEGADAAEQKAAWNYLKTALDEDRLSDRPLFPLEI